MVGDKINDRKTIISDQELLELDVAITQVQSWFSECSMKCPLGNMLRIILKVGLLILENGGNYKDDIG